MDFRQKNSELCHPEPLSCLFFFVDLLHCLQPVYFSFGVRQTQMGIHIHRHFNRTMPHQILQRFRTNTTLRHIRTVGMAADMRGNLWQLPFIPTFFHHAYTPTRTMPDTALFPFFYFNHLEIRNFSTLFHTKAFYPWKISRFRPIFSKKIPMTPYLNNL